MRNFGMSHTKRAIGASFWDTQMTRWWLPGESTRRNLRHFRATPWKRTMSMSIAGIALSTYGMWKSITRLCFECWWHPRFKSCGTWRNVEKLGATCLFAPFFGLLLHAKPWADQEDVVIIGYTNSIRCVFMKAERLLVSAWKGNIFNCILLCNREYIDSCFVKTLHIYAVKKHWSLAMAWKANKKTDKNWLGVWKSPQLVRVWNAGSSGNFLS